MTAQFNEQLDVIMLKEVVADGKLDPAEKGNKKQWDEIAERVTKSMQDYRVFKGKKVNGRQTRERAQKELEQFRKDTSRHLKETGIDEDVNEKDKLLQELLDLVEELKLQRELKMQQEEKKLKDGKTIRHNAMFSLKRKGGPIGGDDDPTFEGESDEENGMPKITDPLGGKRPKTKVEKMMEYLKESNSLRKQELEVQEKKAKTEEKKTDAMTNLMAVLIERITKD